MEMFMYIWSTISEMVHAMPNVSVKDIYEVIYDLSINILTLVDI